MVRDNHVLLGTESLSMISARLKEAFQALGYRWVLQRRDKQMDVNCTLSLVELTVLTDDQGLLLSVAVRQAPEVASLFTVSVEPGRICKLQPPRFAVEPRCRIYFAADVCRIPIAPDPLHDKTPVHVSRP